MREIKRVRTAGELQRLASEFIRDNGGKTSLITVTRVDISPTGKEAKIFFTTLPENQEDTVLKFLIRKSPEFKRFIRDNSRIGFVPHIDFKIDYGERNRQRLDEISKEN